MNDELADLERKLANAERRQRRAENDIDELSHEIDVIHLERDCDTIKSWRGVPDWRELLKANNGMVFYQLSSVILERLGLDHCGVSSTTDQVGLSCKILTHSDFEIAQDLANRARGAIENLPSDLNASDDGYVHISVHSCDDFAVSMLIGDSETDIHLSWQCYGCETRREGFDSIGAAIVFAQDSFAHSADDWELERTFRALGCCPSDTYSGYWLRRAVQAFVEGCVSEGGQLPLYFRNDDQVVIDGSNGFIGREE